MVCVVDGAVFDIDFDFVGYYDNIIFHRIVSGFLVQTGDPTGTGMGGDSFYGGKHNLFHRPQTRASLSHDIPGQGEGEG